MNARRGKLILKILLGLGTIVFAAVLMLWLFDHKVQTGAERTCETLRRQGFKTELADFDFSIPAELREREALLTADHPPDWPNSQFGQSFRLTAVGKRSAIVTWSQDWIESDGDDIHWPDLRLLLDKARSELDKASVAARTGPIRFGLTASRGSAMRLGHLGRLRTLQEALGTRMMLELHDANQDTAWADLLASVRLATAWEPEPVEFSHVARFGCVAKAYALTWQALQSHHWSDEQLASLQREWESVDFFRNLPETAAFERACAVDLCRRDRTEPVPFGMTASEWWKELFRSPRAAWYSISSYWGRLRYRNSGTYQDEQQLLLFYRDREIDLRRAVSAGTWLEMRALPGVTNPTPFVSTRRWGGRWHAMQNLRQLSLAIARQGKASLLGLAAEAEARRRLIIAAVALERWRLRRGSYPETIAGLTAEFLQHEPVDFMDGNPLRYRRVAGNFVLYSVGWDGIDHGGRMPRHDPGEPFESFAPYSASHEVDLVWPRPAATDEVETWHQVQLAERQQRADEMEELQAYARWHMTAVRQAEAARLLAERPKPIPEDLKYRGRFLVDVLRNEAVTGTDQQSLAQLLTLRQLVTGSEPEIITFEAPIRFDALTNIGRLDLLIDVCTNGDFDEGCYAGKAECSRTVDGNCLITWSTLYEAPGLHALQLWLQLNEPTKVEDGLDGPMLPFTITNLCQFSLESATYNPESGAALRAKLPELNGKFTVELATATGEHLKTISGTTSNGVVNVFWNLVDDRGLRFTGESFNSTFKITLPDSKRSQTLKGP